MRRTDPSPSCDAAVIGGGPAGLMAAEVLASAGNRVVVIERMPSLGRRLLMAGRGGLNITHAEPLERFLARYGSAAAWLAPAIRDMPPEAIRAWCAQLGIETFVGSSGRVFPVQMKASPLLRAWTARLSALGVAVRLRCDWRGWDGAALRLVEASGESRLVARAVVMACGGASWPRLGADGSWTTLLPAAAVTPLRPANCGFLCDWSSAFATRFAGHPLKGMAFMHDRARVRGEAVITGAGLEGGAIYALSRHLREAIERDGSTQLQIDLAPDRPAATLVARLAAMPTRLSRANRLRRLGLSPLAVALLREGHGPTLATEPQALAAQIAAVPVRLRATAGMARAISTAGGLRQAAVDSTMMLTDRPGVFAAGEMLDWEAPTGGYLLTAALATGRTAGLAAAGWLARAQGPREAALANGDSPTAG